MRQNEPKKKIELKKEEEKRKKKQKRELIGNHAMHEKIAATFQEPDLLSLFAVVTKVPFVENNAEFD